MHRSARTSAVLLPYAGDLLWQKEWAPQPIYLDFGTASSPVVHAGRIYLLHDSEAESYLTALDARTGQELWRTARPNVGLPRSSWTTPFIWQNERRTEIVTTGHGQVIAYGLDGAELWRIGGMSMPMARPFSANGCYKWGPGQKGMEKYVHGDPSWGSGDIYLRTERSAMPSARGAPACVGLHAMGLVHRDRAYLVHTPGSWWVDAVTGREVSSRRGERGKRFRRRRWPPADESG